eukprot:403342929
MTERYKFFNLGDDKLVYDERKKRFVFLEDAPVFVDRAFRASMFKDQRPDLFGQEQREFKMKLKYGQQLLRQMNYQTKIEMRRLWRTMGGMSFQYFEPLLGDYMNYIAIEKPRSLRLWTWDDSTKIVNFLTLHLMKSQKYGLDIPFNTPVFLDKEQAKVREDELVQYFLYEMRKKPTTA